MIDVIFVMSVWYRTMEYCFNCDIVYQYFSRFSLIHS